MLKIFLIVILMIFEMTTQTAAQDSLQLIATMAGEKAGDQFAVVSGAGDVNGDGFDDMIVGSRFGNYAKLYFGGNSFDTIPEIIFRGGNELFNMGSNVSEAGDVNGDGFDDILLSATFTVDSLFPKGKVFLYLGGNPMDTVPDFVFHEPWIQDGLGGSLAGAGDVNGDGYDDFLIGSPYNWSDGMGRVYLFFGSDSLDNIPDVTFTGEKTGDFFGESVAIGNFNGDEFDDFIISAPSHIDPSNSTNKIYLGGQEIDTLAEFIIRGNDSTNVGLTISSLEDFNGDGNFDFLINYPVSLYFGSNVIDNLNYILFEILEYYENFGYSFSSAGDINGDGLSDIIIGDLNYKSINDSKIGKFYIFLGNRDHDLISDFSGEGETHWGEFSYYLDSAGDLNGDGLDEFLVSAPKYLDHQNPLGKVYVYSYRKTSTIKNNKINKNPKTFFLKQNYPNPFNPTTTIPYFLSKSTFINIEIIDCNGSKIKSLVSQFQTRGHHKIFWNGTNDNGKPVASGIYFVKMTIRSPNDSIEKQKDTIKMIFLK